MQKSIFTIATETAAKLKTPLASAGILTAVATAQIDSGLIDDAFSTIKNFHAQSDKRSFLINAAINSSNNKNTDITLRLLRKLVEIDPESSIIAGRLAQTFLESNEPEAAVKIVWSIDNPFDSWKSRFEFAVKLMDFNINESKRIIETINNADYRDWGELALAQRIIKTVNFNEVIKIIDRFSTPLRQAWACFELSKLLYSCSPDVLQALEKAESIFDNMNIDSKNAESIATALRIIGKFAYNSNKSDDFNQVKKDNVDIKTNKNMPDKNGIAIAAIGEKFLELAETAVILIPTTLQRLRAKLFLAGTLVELGLIDNAKNYIDRRELENGELTAIEQSKIWQWAAESEPSWESDWIKSVIAVSIAQRKLEELGLAERTAEVVRRFALRNNKKLPTGKPDDDTIYLSARQFEEYYYSPFAIEDCGC
ncbi:MAG: hypothetical protein LBE18_12960 [Planctomycetaceae bacterium]|jgi:hypothetical protein|nr:hypothetical protein [Planctomycetaceae bacterium]